MTTATAYELSLDVEHRSLMRMLRERRPQDAVAIENMTKRELGIALMSEFRIEPIRIPKGTPGDRCRSCGAVLYWVPSRATKQYRESVSITGDECREPTATCDGEGFSHLADCARSVYRDMGT